MILANKDEIVVNGSGDEIFKEWTLLSTEMFELLYNSLLEDDTINDSKEEKKKFFLYLTSTLVKNVFGEQYD